MRKTILMVTAMCCMAVAGIYAMNKDDVTDVRLSTEIAGINPFCKAIMQGDLDTVQRMIELGEDVNQKSLGKTPAIFAARYNRADILQLLIDNGADLSKTCEKGFTARKHATLSNAQAALEVIENAMKS